MRRARSNLLMLVWACCFAGALIARTCAPIAASAQSTATPAIQDTTPQGPVLTHRSASAPEAAGRRIQLDVVVTDKQGAPFFGLERNDFTLLDNKKAQGILAFHASKENTITSTPETPSEVILVLDAVNGTFQEAAFAREQTAKFLRQNGGHLAIPVSIAVFTSEGLRIQPRPSSDGNALAALLEQASAGLQSAGSAAGSYGEIGRFQLSVKTLAAIAENEANRPGRKMLIWIGPGWPLLGGPNMASSAQDRQRFFDVIVELSTRLREARIALYSVSSINPVKGNATRMPPTSAAVTAGMVSAEAPQAHRVSEGNSGAPQELNYKEFLKGVKSARQADAGNLSLQVLAVQSGGRVLDPSNDLISEISHCLADLDAFYTISFDPPVAEHADEYHELKVVVNKPGLSARSYSGYYNHP